MPPDLTAPGLVLVAGLGQRSLTGQAADLDGLIQSAVHPGLEQRLAAESSQLTVTVVDPAQEFQRIGGSGGHAETIPNGGRNDRILSAPGATNKPMRVPNFRTPKAIITVIYARWSDRDRTFAGRHVCTPPICRTCGATNGESK